MSKSNQLKSQKLGMNFSTASNRLRRILMFNLLKECNKNTCYRCKSVIQSPDDFSIDHKVDWMYSKNPIQLFWDVDNIAFSHKSCNIRAGRLPKEGRYKGVTKLKGTKQRNKPYQARFWDGKKQVLIGYYTDAKEAAKAYDTKISGVLGNKIATNKMLGLME